VGDDLGCELLLAVGCAWTVVVWVKATARHSISDLKYFSIVFLLYDNFIRSRSWFIARRHMSSFLWTGVQYCVSFY
jgi:hypothetical protein